MTVLIDYTKGFFETTEGDTVGTVTGNATLDLSTGSVFSHTPTANTTFAFSNPPASGTASSTTLKLTGANVTSGYDLANASYDSVSFSFASQTSDARGLAFSVDGDKMYLLDGTNKSVYQYSLSTAWDVSTASYDSVSFSVNSQDTSPLGIAFNNTGSKMYVSGGTTGAAYQYSLSTAFDLSTASYDSVSLSSFNEKDVVFNAGGTRLFGVDGSTVYQYSLSTAFDLSTATYDSVSFSVSSQETAPQGLAFSSGGNKMFILGYNSDTVFEYSLSTPFDLSTASYASISFSVSSQMNWPLDLVFSFAGDKMYALSQGSPSAVFQYSTGSTALATITYPASVIWSGGTTPTAPANGETDVYTFYTDDGGTTYYGFQVGDALA